MIATVSILIAVLATTLMIIEKQMEVKNLDTFKDQVYSVINKLQSGNTISYLWMAEQESKYHMILHIEDNGNPFTYPGNENFKTAREDLTNQLKEKALNENINMNQRPISSNEHRSSIIQFTGNHNEDYIGIAVVLAMPVGYRSFLLIQALDGLNAALFRQRILFIILALAGSIALNLVSRKLVDLSLSPAKETYKKQVEFIAAASHELRSPITVIRAYNSALQLDHSQLNDCTAVIESECKRVARLIEDMLVLASTDAKSWPIKKEQIDTDQLLLDTYELYQPLYKEKKAKLAISLPEEALPPIHGDMYRLQQVLTILLDNALSYSNKGRTPILLRSYKKKHNLLIEVEDHGIGIPDDQKPYIFDRFYRSDKSRTDKTHFGLGLSIAKELILLHGGTLSLKDTKNGGCTFVIQLPVQTEKAKAN